MRFIFKKIKNKISDSFKLAMMSDYERYMSESVDAADLEYRQKNYWRRNAQAAKIFYHY